MRMRGLSNKLYQIDVPGTEKHQRHDVVLYTKTSANKQESPIFKLSSLEGSQCFPYIFNNIVIVYLQQINNDEPVEE